MPKARACQLFSEFCTAVQLKQTIYSEFHPLQLQKNAICVFDIALILLSGGTTCLTPQKLLRQYFEQSMRAGRRGNAKVRL